MDAATLRIILLVLGALLLGAMYLWERRRAAERSEREGDAPTGPPQDAPPRRREPSLRELDLGARPRDESSAELTAANAGEALSGDSGAMRGTAAAAEPEESPVSRDGGDSPSPEVETPAEPTAPARPASERPEASGSAAPEVPDDGMIVQLFVFSQAEGFSGPAIEAATQRQHLIPGEMDIYHRRSLDGTSSTARFSMANLVKPGTFPFDAMEGFSTPGLALFAQFDGRPSDLMVYDELVQTAGALADELGGEVATKDRRRFDDAAWERLRSRLLRLIDARADALTGAPEPVVADAGGGQSTVNASDGAASAPAEPVPPDPR